jgi:hypothetical protein
MKVLLIDCDTVEDKKHLIINVTGVNESTVTDKQTFHEQVYEACSVDYTMYSSIYVYDIKNYSKSESVGTGYYFIMLFHEYFGDYFKTTLQDMCLYLGTSDVANQLYEVPEIKALFEFHKGEIHTIDDLLQEYSDNGMACIYWIDEKQQLPTITLTLTP